MMRFILTAVLALGATSAFAGELDNESGVTNKQLSGTLVLRVDTRTQESAFVKLDKGLNSEAEAKSLAQSAKFNKVQVRSELDQDGGASSWYFYSPYQYPYYTPVCNYYGNSYNPYYSYNYGYYNYYYYGSYWSYGR
ncbi:MAG: hypothetical protein EOP04_27030 [Proteobacteria bacterium]|nr:MAG: hypothetical protein EOP04_27030 [Pseudomonadota bacterium]